MKANKKGISLIVLIITIVVIIILAAAIILNLSNTNIIKNARTAVSENDRAEVQSAVTLAYGDVYFINMSEGTGEVPSVDDVLAALPTDLTTKYKIVAESENVPEDTQFVVSPDFAVSIYKAQ